MDRPIDPLTGKPVTPSMDDKDTPSPPVRTHEKYAEDKALGINRVAKPTYKGGES